MQSNWQAGSGPVADYFTALGWSPLALMELNAPRYNIPPGTRPAVLQLSEHGNPRMEPIFWGYKRRAEDKKPYSNARLDTILKRGFFWKPLLSNRVIVPAEGWYEWTNDDGVKNPWFIRAKDNQPLLMAGISS